MRHSQWLGSGATSGVSQTRLPCPMREPSRSNSRRKASSSPLGACVYDPADPIGKMFFKILATFAKFEASSEIAARHHAKHAL